MNITKAVHVTKTESISKSIVESEWKAQETCPSPIVCVASPVSPAEDVSG